MVAHPVTESDEDLVLRCQAGDNEAFGALVERHEKVIYRYAYRLLRNHEDARDAAQETFVSAFRSLARFRAEGRFVAWLFSIVSHVCISWLRRNRRHRERRVEWDEAVSEGGDVAGGGALADPPLERRDQMRQIERAVARLPVAYRQVIVLRYEEDLSCEEIAKVLGIGTGAARMRLFRAHRLLRRQVGETEVAGRKSRSPGRLVDNEM